MKMISANVWNISYCSNVEKEGGKTIGEIQKIQIHNCTTIFKFYDWLNNIFQ